MENNIKKRQLNRQQINRQNFKQLIGQQISCPILVEKQRQKNELYPLYIRIYVYNARPEIASTHYVNLKTWDSVKMRLKPSAQNAIFLNGYVIKSD